MTTASMSFARPVDASVDLHLLNRRRPDRYPFLLQSTAANPDLGRFDILFACPGESLVLERVGALDPEGGFLAALDDRWRRESLPPADAALPFIGGWFLYLGYELAGEIEPAVDVGADDALPAAFAVRCRAAVIRDRIDGGCWLVAERGADIDTDRLTADLAACRRGADDLSLAHGVAPVVSEEAEAAFLDAVAVAKRHIAAGDVYQTNLSRGWSATVEGRLDVDRTYAALCLSNPGPFAGLVRWRDSTVISSSPERLIRIRDGNVSTRPIAGTRPRSDERSLDDSLSAELLAHPKERAEHVMLIDLERNDLGRICVPGSVEVDEMMVLESYAHVHHIVSNVRGRLRSGVTPGGAIRAVFPGGTITGCPKVRCMQVIAALEATPRGAYTGSFGYLNRDGSLDLNILIRTMVSNGNEIRFRAGAGIVADSEPGAELLETRAKAMGMLKALGA